MTQEPRRLRIDAEADWTLIPRHMRAAITDYVEQRWRPGHFLLAVLANDLEDAVRHADGQNRAALADWIIFLTNFVPAACWGSPEKVEEWAPIADSFMGRRPHGEPPEPAP